jgi:hypothetical protein
VVVRAQQSSGNRTHDANPKQQQRPTVRAVYPLRLTLLRVVSWFDEIDSANAAGEVDIVDPRRRREMGAARDSAAVE